MTAKYLPYRHEDQRLPAYKITDCKRTGNILNTAIETVSERKGIINMKTREDRDLPEVICVSLCKDFRNMDNTHDWCHLNKNNDGFTISSTPWGEHLPTEVSISGFELTSPHPKILVLC